MAKQKTLKQREEDAWKKQREIKAKQNNDLFRDEPMYPKQKIKLSIPMPPSVNHMYVRLRGGGQTLTATARNYLHHVQHLCVQALEEQQWQEDRPDVWYYADLYFYMPDRRIRDTHNTFKLMLDSMEGKMFRNDYFIMPRVQDVQLDSADPRVDIILFPQKVSM